MQFHRPGSCTSGHGPMIGMDAGAFSPHVALGNLVAVAGMGSQLLPRHVLGPGDGAQTNAYVSAALA